jgi:phospho-N-acetylmuramoyl-pentapeptide-transferase
MANIVDNPIVTEHRHKAGTPTMGGLAIILAVIFTSGFYFSNLNLILTALIMVTAGIIGLMDDLIGLKIKDIQKVIRNIDPNTVKIGRLTLKNGEEARVATKKAKKDVVTLLENKKVEIIGEVPIKSEVKESEKIFAQFIISLFLIVTGAVSSEIIGFNLGIFVIPIIIFGIIGSINAINLIDGMDGLASGIIAIASSACAIFTISNGNFNGSIPFLTLSGVCFAFLIFNKYPTTIFMGDTGSFALGAGYITAVFLGNIFYFGIIAITIPILSVIISLLHRAHIIKLPVEPLHHTLHYKGLSEKKIVMIYWIITLFICVSMIFFYNYL